MVNIFMGQGISPTTVYDYPFERVKDEFFIATDNFHFDFPWYGANSICVIVPKGIDVKVDEFGHCSIYDFNDFSVYGSNFLPVFNDMAIPGIKDMLRKKRVEENNFIKESEAKDKIIAKSLELHPTRHPR